MGNWIRANFPSGHWTWGWVGAEILCFLAITAVCICLNLRDGFSWDGRTKR